MGRPTASKENKQFGAFFANVVTVPIETRGTTVARSGEGSVFYVFVQCFPELVRTHARNGLTQLEFNKFLQSNDFPLIRKRNRGKTCTSPKKKLAFFPPSSFRFAGRRWRNPDNLEDLAYLRSAWPIVTKGLNAISFEGFCDAVRDAIRIDMEFTAEMEASSEAMSACSTPRASSKCEKLDFFDDCGDLSDSESGEIAEELFSSSDDHLLDLPLVDDEEACLDASGVLGDEEELHEVGPKRRQSEKWIDAQTFLEQCKSDIGSVGLEFPELWAFVHGTPLTDEASAIACGM